MRAYNFFVSWPEFTRFFLPNRRWNALDQVLFGFSLCLSVHKIFVGLWLKSKVVLSLKFFGGPRPIWGLTLASLGQSLAPVKNLRGQQRRALSKGRNIVSRKVDLGGFKLMSYLLDSGPKFTELLSLNAGGIALGANRKRILCNFLLVTNSNLWRISYLGRQPKDVWLDEPGTNIRPW